ncbi:RagB/SusD family nutrient uptake outer membrane protein [Niabella hirudinis]|uniref:RagB/SusD family nutrient uptake outer membrane protein n=1 Tax=Niabella hirudinis TaxID=1285929 RepID=UPI003EB866D8
MKKIFVFIFIVIISGFSCNRDRFLAEDPLDFYTADNAFNSAAGFQSSINYLHNQMRAILFGGYNLESYFPLRYATDFAVNATDYAPPAKLNDYKNTMVPTYTVPEAIWRGLYLVVSNANVVITRSATSTVIPEADRVKFKAQALFFRAWAYNFLANLYGGVPLILEETVVPRRDYTRGTRDEVYTQCKKDLTEAIPVLGNVDAITDGAVNKQAAQHLLTEVLISLKDFGGAVAAASAVISYPGLSLMKNRFGRHATREGDVYKDLFELNNQNRSSGNREGIFIIQADYQNAATATRDAIQWAIIPFLSNLRVSASVGGAAPVSQPAIKGFNDKLAGRGVGWMRPSDYFLYEVWDDPNDMRNSKYNIVRDIRLDGPPANSDAYGKYYVADGYKAKATSFADTIRNWFPILKKATLSEGDFPQEVWQKNAAGNPVQAPFGGILLLNSSGDVYQKDVYLMRLAETYLLRAEAYLKNNELGKAADDINVVRARANAHPVTPAQMSIDFLLDERLRELYVEELRTVTLCRMGMLYDRTKRYNEKSGMSIESYHNLWPIPYAEIERNTGAVLEQNPGYK